MKKVSTWHWQLRVSLPLLVAVVSGCAIFDRSPENVDDARKSTVAASSKTDDQEETPGVLEQATVMVDDAQRVASLRFLNFMAEVDGFFSNGSDKADAVSNESWARLRVDAEKPGDEDAEIGGSIKVRAVFPETERRLRLLLSTEDDESDFGEVANTSTSNDDQNASLALRFIRSARTKSSVNFDLGVRQRDSAVQIFGRINTTYRDEFWENWTGRYSNSYYYFSKSGFENRLNLVFRRPLYNKQDLFFRTSTDFNWRNGQKGAVIDETLGIYRQINDAMSLAVEGLASYHTALNDGVDERFRGSELRVRWRHNVWREWFFYEFWPSVSWPASNQYRSAYGALLRIEVVIGQQ